MAGALFGTAVPGAPPTLAFGGNHDSILPFQLEVASCAAIRTAGAPCDVVAYAAQRPPPTQDPCVLDAVP